MYETSPFLVHGSEDSLDKDVVYILPKMPSFVECQQFCSKKSENRNIIVMDSKNHVVQECFKGLPDEINNSLLRTTVLHEQKYKNPIQQSVVRIIPLKVCCGSVEGIELYTKREISNQFTDLHQFMYRKQDILSKLDILNLYKKKWLEHLKHVQTLKFLDNLNAFFVKQCDSKLELYKQCNGMIIDMTPGKERCICFPAIDKYEFGKTVLVFEYKQKMNSIIVDEKMQIQQVNVEDAKKYHNVYCTFEKSENGAMHLIGLRDRFTNKILKT